MLLRRGLRKKKVESRDRGGGLRGVPIEPDGKSVRSILEHVNAELTRLGLGEDGTWGAMFNIDEIWPIRYRWISVFPVTGGSEGHYMHLDLYLRGYVGGGDSRTPGVATVQHMALCKTFSGIEHANAVCHATRLMLGA